MPIKSITTPKDAAVMSSRRVLGIDLSVNNVNTLKNDADLKQITKRLLPLSLLLLL